MTKISDEWISYTIERLGKAGTLQPEHNIVLALTELQSLRAHNSYSAEPVAFVVSRPTRSGGTAMHLPFLRAGEEADRYRAANPSETLIALYLASTPAKEVEQDSRNLAYRLRYAGATIKGPMGELMMEAAAALTNRTPDDEV